MDLFVEKMDACIAKYQTEFDASGSVRVTKQGEIIYEKCFGYSDWEKKLPITKDSVYTLYSMSKPFCAIGLMKLKERGLVDIDRHPAEYVPEMKGFDSRLTIRHMLYHESGLPDFGQIDDFAQNHAPGTPDKIREHLKLLKNYPMLFEPGTGVCYSNINFTVSALIIENVTSMRYDEYMQKEVFGPLGAKTAQIDHVGLELRNRVSGHTKEDGRIVLQDRSLDWMMGGGDVVGTLDDVYCLNLEIKNRKVLKNETWNEMLTPSEKKGSFAIGCIVMDWNGRCRIQHNGGHKGFRTIHVQLPEDDLDIIFLANCDWKDLRYPMVNDVYEAYYSAANKRQDMPEMDKGYV